LNTNWHDADGQWWRSHGNENWEFDADGYMAKRYASINDQAISEAGAETETLTFSAAIRIESQNFSPAGSDISLQRTAEANLLNDITALERTNRQPSADDLCRECCAKRRPYASRPAR